MDLKEETVSETIEATSLSEERRRTAPFMSKSLNFEVRIRFRDGFELFVRQFDFGGFELMSGRPDDDMKLDIINLIEEAIDDSCSNDDWLKFEVLQIFSECIIG